MDNGITHDGDCLCNDGDEVGENGNVRQWKFKFNLGQHENKSEQLGELFDSNWTSSM